MGGTGSQDGHGHQRRRRRPSNRPSASSAGRNPEADTANEQLLPFSLVLGRLLVRLAPRRILRCCSRDATGPTLPGAGPSLRSGPGSLAARSSQRRACAQSRPGRPSHGRQLRRHQSRLSKCLVDPRRQRRHCDGTPRPSEASVTCDPHSDRPHGARRPSREQHLHRPAPPALRRSSGSANSVGGPGFVVVSKRERTESIRRSARGARSGQDELLRLARARL